MTSLADGTLTRGISLTPLGVVQGQKPYNNIGYTGGTFNSEKDRHRFGI